LDVGRSMLAPLPILMTFPLPASAHRPDVEVAAQLRAAGFVRAQLDGVLARLDPPDAEQRGARGAGSPRGGGPPPGFRCDAGRLAERGRQPPSTKARGLPSRSTTAIAVSLLGSSHVLELRHGRARAHADPVFVQQPAGWPAPDCNGFGARPGVRRIAIVPQPRKQPCAGVRSIRGPSRAMRAAVASCARPRGPRASRSMRRGEDLTSKADISCSNGASGRFLGMLPFLQRLEAKRYKQYIRVFLRQYSWRKSVPPAAARGSSPKRSRSAWAVGRSRTSPRSRPAPCATGSGRSS